MQELVYSAEETLRNLKKAISGRYGVAKERAKAEYAYRSALGKEMAYAKAEGMAATSLYQYCKAIEYVAKLREERDVLLAKENYLDELVYYYRAELRVIEGQLKAERQGL